MGLRPAFSAKVKGMISKAVAYALRQMASIPSSLSAKAANLRASSVSGAPPPAITAFLRTKQRTTHKASCKDRSASSSTSLLDPRTSKVIVRPGF